MLRSTPVLSTVRRALRPVVLASRHRGILATDVWIASYPRSGSTWLRFMLAELLLGPAEFTTVNRVIPGVGHHHEAPDLLSPSGRLIQTHELRSDQGNRAVYLVRDVRDVALSEHAATVRAGAEWSFDEFLTPFLAGRLDTFGPWHRHVAAWLDGPAATKGRLLAVRFEEMRSDPEGHLHRVAGFLDVEADPNRVRDAVAANAIERMRVKESRAPAGTFVKARSDMTFVRRGLAGGWRDVLTPQQVDRILSVMGPTMTRLGYEH